MIRLMRIPLKRGESAPIQPGPDWRWRVRSMDDSKPLVTREELVDLLAAVGGPDRPWITLEAGHGAGHRWAQAFGERDALNIEISEPSGWASRVTDLGVPPRGAVFAASDAASLVSLWLARQELPLVGYGLVEVGAEDDQPRRPC